MDKTLENLETSIYSFQMMMDQTKIMFDEAKAMDRIELAVHAKKALDGLTGMVRYFEEAHTAIWASLEPVRIPVVDESRPKLTIINGGGGKK